MGHRRCSILIDLPEQALTTANTLIGRIPDNACEGQMTFVKRSTGDEIYIGLRGKKPGPKNYNIVLTDDLPAFSEDGLVVGEINAVSSSATGNLSTYVSGNAS